MMRKAARRHANVCLAAAVILTCLLAQTVDCYRLRKTQRQEGWKDVGAPRIGVSEGDILFGKVLEKGSAPTEESTKPSNASVEDETAYQADWTGWTKGQIQDLGVKEAAWNRMSPSLQCGWDQMKFRAVGPGASQLALGQGNAPPVPLSQVPPACGYTLNSNSMLLLMLVPYNGCNVVQEGGGYTLPMQWQGVPVSLRCTKPAVPGPADPGQPALQKIVYPPLNPQVPSTDPVASNPQIPPPYFFPPNMMYPPYGQYSQYPSLVLPKPGTPGPADPSIPAPQKPVDPPLNPQVPSKYPDASNPQIPPPFFYPHHMMYPQYGQYSQYPPLVLPKPAPAGPAAPSIPAPQKPMDPPLIPQVPSKYPDASNPQIPPLFFYPHHMMYPQYGQYSQYPPLVLPKPATPGPADPSIPAPQKPMDPPLIPQVPSKYSDASNPQIPPPYFFPPHMMYPQYAQYPSLVVQKPAAPAKTPGMPQLPQLPQYFFLPPISPTTAAPTTAAKQVTIAPPQFPLQMPVLPPFRWPPAQFPSFGKPTTSQTPTNPAAKPQVPQLPSLPFVPPYLVPLPLPQYPSHPAPPTTQAPTESVNMQPPVPSHLGPFHFSFPHTR